MADSPSHVADSFERDFKRLLASADTNPERSVGNWTVKQIIAHIAAWDHEILTALDDVVAGQPVHYAAWDEDEYNRTVASQSQTESWLSVRARAVAANRLLVERIRCLRPDELLRPASGAWGDGSPMTPASVLGYTYKGRSHYAGHAGELEEAP